MGAFRRGLPIWRRSAAASTVRRNTIERGHFRTSSGRFWRNTAPLVTRRTSGMDRRDRSGFQPSSDPLRFHSRGDAPGWDGSGLWAWLPGWMDSHKGQRPADRPAWGNAPGQAVRKNRKGQRPGPSPLLRSPGALRLRLDGSGLPRRALVVVPRSRRASERPSEDPADDATIASGGSEVRPPYRGFNSFQNPNSTAPRVSPVFGEEFAAAAWTALASGIGSP